VAVLGTGLVAAALLVVAAGPASAGGTPTAAVAPASVFFPEQGLGQASAAQTVTVTAGGTAPLVVSQLTLAGADAADFALVGDGCSGATLPPGGSCTAGVTFTPQGLGFRSAVLEVADDAAGSPQTVVLAGTVADCAAGAAGSAPLVDWRLDEPQGTTAYDSSGNGNVGADSATGITYSAPGPLACDPEDTAVSLDGASGEVTATTAALAGGAFAPPSFTVQAWVRPAVVSGTQYVVADDATPSTRRGFALYLVNNVPRFSVGNGSRVRTASSATRVTAGTWYLVTGVYSAGGKPTIFVDAGAPSSSFFALPAMVAGASALTVGRDPLGTSFLRGSVGQVRVYTSALSRAAIAAQYAAARATLSVTPPPSLSWSAVLTGYDQTIDASGAVAVVDTASPAAGWHLSVSATPFTCSTGPNCTTPRTLPSGALTVNGSATSAAATQPPGTSCQGPCTPPGGNLVYYPLAVTATAASLFTAGAGTGSGTVLLQPYWWLTVPADTSAGTYVSTITLAIGSGP